MSSLAYEVTMNSVLIVIYVVIGLLLIQRIMEKRGFTYHVQKTPDGLVFKYTLGIYAGCVRITRDTEYDEPVIRKRSDGWQITFPAWYTDHQIYRYIERNNPVQRKSSSHANDIEIFRQAVLKNNDKLMSIGGRLYTGDRRKHPR